MLFRFSLGKDGKPIKKAIVYTATETGIQINKIDPDALYVIKKLKNSCYETYLVGGAVRDLLIGKTPKDFDIVTSATPAKIKRLFYNSRIIGKRFRLVHIFFGKKIFEVSTFRSIKNGTIGNEFGNIEEDVLRRDFSINALYLDPIKNQVIDYVGGVADIKKQVLSPVIPLDLIFTEDPVRMLRAIKYSCTTHCTMSLALRKKIKKSAPLLAPISHSRLTEELTKMINTGSCLAIAKEAINTGIYLYLQPAAYSMLKTHGDFAKTYFKDLEELDALIKTQNTDDMGQKLMFLIISFVRAITPKPQTNMTKGETAQMVFDTYSRCKDFLQPMQPQKTQLEYAVRLSLRKIGIQVKLPRRGLFGTLRK